MFKKSLLLLLCLFLADKYTLAQTVPVCAQTRLSTSQRQAVATPEHQRLMNMYDMTLYKLDLQLERNNTFIEGNAILEAKAKTELLSTFAFELHPNFVIEKIEVNGQAVASFSRNSSDVAVPLTTPVAPSQKISVRIFYKGNAPSEASAAIGNGFNTASTPFRSNVTWSLSEPYAAYEWWPTKQVLTDKADSVHVYVTTASDNKVGSNGLLTRVVELPDGRKRHEWKSTYPIAYYLVSVAISDYEEYTTFANPAGAEIPIPIVNYVYGGNALQYYKDNIDMTGPLIEYFSNLFTLYPFSGEKYGHSMAPMGGGMEHQTMTTLSSFDFTLNAHELAHQWFGNNVTCASWQDIWLNEGFASYAEYLALQKFNPDRAQRWIESAQSWGKGELEGSVMVTDTSKVGRIFDYALSYKKAAAVIHMLRYTIANDVLFFQALRNYQQRFGGSTATTEDMQQVMEETTGLDLDYFFDQWYRGNGFPVHTVDWTQKGNVVTVTTTQTPTGTTPLFRMDMQYLFRTSAGDTTIQVAHNQLQEQYQFNLKGTVHSIKVDPNSWLLQNTREIASGPGPVLGTEDDLIAANVVVYPNPVPDHLRVANLPFQPKTAAIFDATGKLVRTYELPPAVEVQLEVNQLKNGLYHLYLSNGKEHYRSKFIKTGIK